MCKQLESRKIEPQCQAKQTIHQITHVQPRTILQNFLDNKTLGNILTTANHTRDDKNRKRTIETINNSSNVAKVVTDEARHESIPAYGGDKVALASAPALLPAPLTHPPRKEERAASPAREDGVSQQSMAVEMNSAFLHHY